MTVRKAFSALLCAALLAQPLAAAARERPARYDGNYFDGSRSRDGAVRGKRSRGTGFWNDPDKGKLRVREGRFKPRGVPAASRQPAAAQAQAKAQAPHLSWDWDKTVIAAHANLAGAAIGFLLGGPIGAAVGFLGGMFLGAIAANLKKDEEKPAEPAS